MKIGVPREVKDGEARVALTPQAARTVVDAGHALAVQSGAGLGSGFADTEFAAAGADIVADPQAVYDCELVVKVKEFQPQEYPLLRSGCVVLGYQQLARDPLLLQAVLDGGVTCIAAETVRDASGRMPILAPMSRIAGRMAPLIAAHWLQRTQGGSGVMLAGDADGDSARVVVIGAGNVGLEAARVARALGCRVTVFARRPGSRGGIPVQGASAEALALAVRDADALVGAVLEPGALSPRLITRDMLGAMHPGSVFLDVGIDMGGIAATSRQTSLSAPTYVEEGVIHYCVPNIPATVPRSATVAFAQAVLPYVIRIADSGFATAARMDEGLAAAVLTRDGTVVHARLAQDTKRECGVLRL
jgi:alanine dehydrogenase